MCVEGWTDTIRPDSSVINRMKRDSMAEYGAKGKPSAYEYDHLISLQLAATRRIRTTCGRSPMT
jgi:hypothetical protein